MVSSLASYQWVPGSMLCVGTLVGVLIRLQTGRISPGRLLQFPRERETAETLRYVPEGKIFNKLLQSMFQSFNERNVFSVIIYASFTMLH